MMMKPLQVWAGDDDNDDWHCVQTLDESSKYITISLFSHAGPINSSSLVVVLAVTFSLTRFNLIMMSFSSQWSFFYSLGSFF